MAVIIDANRVEDFGRPLRCYAPEILKRVAKRRMKIVVGGKLLRELSKTHMRDFLVEWSRIGCLIRVECEIVDQEEKRIQAGSMKSDDPHVLAVALISESRLLYTNDHALMQDFKDRLILDPKGKIVSPSTPERIANSLFDRYGA